jgi:citrate lyase subunit beta/citryl-CoA lyase
MRSLLFVPANNEKYFEKAVISEADALVLDLEDAVAASDKAEARRLLNSHLDDRTFNGQHVYIRTNATNVPDIISDIRVGIHEDINGFLIPKISNIQDIQFASRLLDLLESERGFEKNSFSLVPMVETAGAVMNLKQIVKASNRISAVCFGGYDLRSELKIMNNAAVSFQAIPRALIVIAAREAGVLPIDTPYFILDDINGLKAEKDESFSLGFAGSLVINPRHISTVNECFTPDKATIGYAEKVVTAVEKGGGCAVVDGRLVDEPVVELAQEIMDMMSLISKGDDVS